MTSVVIPVFNASHYLRQCLDSVLAQTYAEMELLCIDDGSTDGSLDILREYAKKDSRIQVFRKENDGGGAANARNIGLNKSSGEYVVFLDADDFFEKEMLFLMVAKAEETNADVVICRADRFDDSSGKITGSYRSIHLEMAPKGSFFSWQDCPDQIFQIGDTITWNKLYRKSFLIEKELRFEPIPISDDQYVPSLALALANRIAVIDQVFVHYRYNTGMSQVDTYARHPSSAYRAAYSIVDRMRQAGLYNALKRSYLNTAVRLLRDYYDKIDTYADFCKQHELYLSEVLPYFGAQNLPADYFYDKKLGDWYQMIVSESPGEILFRVARAYSEDTTRVLRE